MRIKILLLITLWPALLSFVAATPALFQAPNSYSGDQPPLGALVVRQIQAVPGEFSNLSQAIGSLATKEGPQVIFIYPGHYRESVKVNYKFPLIIQGYTKNSSDYRHNQVKVENAVSAASVGGNAQSSAIWARTDFFTMLNINVTNSYGNGTDTQAVAVTADGDYQVYKGCVIDSFQDTLYIKSTSSYFFRCLIAGSVDFIFGAGTAWFEKSKIAVKQSHSINIITAQRKTVLKTQFVFNDSRVVALGNVANQSTYLGRPWSENASVTYQFCKLSNIIKPEGWRFWNPNDQRTQNIKFFEFQNTGPGSLGERKYGRRAEAALNITEVLGSDPESWI